MLLGSPCTGHSPRAVFILKFPKSEQALALAPQCEEQGSVPSATQESWPLYPSRPSQFWHRCVLQTSGSSGILQRISTRKGSHLLSCLLPTGTFFMLSLQRLLQSADSEGQQNAKRSLREAQVRNTGSALRDTGGI